MLEESWKKELFELSSYTKQLQEENQRLCSMMHDQNRMESTVLGMLFVFCLKPVISTLPALLKIMKVLNFIR